MGLFRRTEPTPPTDQQIRDAGRQLQQGGLLGRGSSRAATKLTRRVGPDGSPEARAMAMRILHAAADYPPNS